MPHDLSPDSYSFPRGVRSALHRTGTQLNYVVMHPRCSYSPVRTTPPSLPFPPAPELALLPLFLRKRRYANPLRHPPLALSGLSCSARRTLACCGLRGAFSHQPIESPLRSILAAPTPATISAPAPNASLFHRSALPDSRRGSVGKDGLEMRRRLKVPKSVRRLLQLRIFHNGSQGEGFSESEGCLTWS